MMVETATVMSYRNGLATVQCSAKSACGSCTAKESCGTKSLSALAGEKFTPQFELKVNEPLAVGEQIRIGLAEQTLLRSVFWIYAVPLFVIILSAVGFSQLFTNELWVVLAMCICTGGTFIGIKKMMSKIRESEFTPVFLGRI
ncbi:SoxR reducing system RseC family protein [Actinobacillus equuli subsp. equuli]|uniref:Sigma-E factor regulatory protein n=1 Tax=Actinobacillus equuli TaxID=718 RepID=A0AAX3FGV0_ACTEU|nr:SoxR reducing system RseC family protein [Actinobacillus equuli]AIZ79231.1 sigma-E factor regulatory protein [Actinobacillus equuli subsp. equuli]MDG4952475.1 SoxR reducing system RseC family protein [Actinobacillus equuli subsp. equuli]WGE45469.1 SoxR reducing system RseC family protein [Actinobacillus equuli subsp. equuli]WGE49725.1 SoxR reducing system RseC family protein [Actinobacillus equuli subsp. equuli]WGE56097.1 SoxR reducing system RseC family protein [Actinobacillus equuli subsp